MHLTVRNQYLAHQDKIQQLLAAFLSGRNQRTIDAYSADLDDFRAYLRAGDIDAASRILLTMEPGDANAAVLGYRSHLVDRGLSPATINRRLAALRSLVKLGRILGAVTWTLEVPNLKAQAYRDTKGPGRPAVRAMMDHCRDRGDRKGVRDFALLRMLFDLGLRRSEASELDLEHINLEAATVSILGKGRIQRETLSMPRATIEALRAWISVRGSKPGPLFTSCDNARKGNGRLSSEGVYKTVRRIGERVGVKTRPHGIRHTAITEAVKAATSAGYGLEEVTDFSRHASVTTLMIYRDRERNVQGKLAEAVAAGM